jgi:uncharacterized protein YlxP (DUF503 family)
VTIDRRKGSGSNETKTLVEWNVQVCIGIPKFFRQPKIDEVYNVGALSDTHDDVARFEIAVNEVARMDVLQATELGIVDIGPSAVVSEVKFTHQLPSQEQHSPDRELKMAVNKEVLKRLAEAIDRHHIEASFRTKPMDMRDTGPSLKLCVYMKLVV